MTHCGYEPTASLGLQAQARRHVEEYSSFNFGAKTESRPVWATKSRPTMA